MNHEENHEEIAAEYRATRDAARARGEDVDPHCEADETCRACGGWCRFAYTSPQVMRYIERPPVVNATIGQRVWSAGLWGQVKDRRMGRRGPELLIVWESRYDKEAWVMEGECYA